MFGKNVTFQKDERIVSIQTISATGALYLGFYFIANFLPDTPRTIYLSDPTWPTHSGVIQAADLKVAYYPYYDHEIKALNFKKLRQIDIEFQAFRSTNIFLGYRSNNFDLC